VAGLTAVGVAAGVAAAVCRFPEIRRVIVTVRNIENSVIGSIQLAGPTLRIAKGVLVFAAAIVVLIVSFRRPRIRPAQGKEALKRGDERNQDQPQLDTATDDITAQTADAARRLAGWLLEIISVVSFGAGGLIWLANAG
jgi:hypothetical protein